MIIIKKRELADGVIATENGVVLIKRLYKPYKGCWALPGGHVEGKDFLNTNSKEDAYKKAVEREIKEETGLIVEIIRKIGDYINPSPRQIKMGYTRRDPRGDYTTHAYLVKVVGGELKASDDAKEVSFFKKIPDNIAFDHDEILKDSDLFENGIYVGLKN